MEGCFIFQWGRLFFRWGASFLSGGVPHEGASVLVREGGGGVRKKSLDVWGAPHAPLPLWETLKSKIFLFTTASNNSF